MSQRIISRLTAGFQFWIGMATNVAPCHRRTFHSRRDTVRPTSLWPKSVLRGPPACTPHPQRCHSSFRLRSSLRLRGHALCPFSQTYDTPVLSGRYSKSSIESPVNHDATEVPRHSASSDVRSGCGTCRKHGHLHVVLQEMKTGKPFV